MGLSARGFSQPVITNQPQNQTAIAGATGTFTVGATGTPPLSYQWRNYLNSTTFTNIPFGTEATLSLTNVQLTQRRFGVVVTDGGSLSVTSSLAILTVLFPPVITQAPTNQSILPGNGATLRVTATGTAPLSYQWMFNSPTNPIPGATAATWIIPRLQSNQVGNYFVVITNVAGAVTSPPARLTLFWAPMTGTDIPALARLDTNMQSILWTYGIPGGALAVVKDGRLVFARGYGYADTNTGEVVQPDSLFRVASLSKAITTAATLKLVEQGAIALTNSAFGVLDYPPANYPGWTNDPRLSAVLIRDLLQHTGGWDSSTAINPNGKVGFYFPSWTERAAHDMGVQGPISAQTLVQWMMGIPLQYQPGSRWVYSDVGWLVLGRIIEKITGQSYEAYVRSLLNPLGISRMRIGRSSAAERHHGEVHYYDYPLNISLPYWVSALGVEPRTGDVTLPYAYPVEAIDAAGFWTACPMDYLRFVNAVDGRPSPPDILTASTIITMTTPSPPSISAGQPYGMGWYVDYPGPGDWLHYGSFPGTRARVLRLANGISYMFIMNLNPLPVETTSLSFPDTLAGISQITAWPTNDFFATTLSYDAWREQHFTAAELADPAISGDHANPDGDDSVNLLEYATGSDPKSSASDRQPTGSFVTVDGQSYFALTFRRLLLGYELNYVVEASNDLLAWSPVTESVGSPQLNPDGTQTVTIRDSAPANATSQRYLRLRVSRQ